MKLFLRSVVAFSVATFSTIASAQQLIWVGGSTGDFNTANNWNTNADGSGTFGVPNSTTVAAVYPDNFENGGPYNITITMSQNNTVQGLQVSHLVEFVGATQNGTVTLNSSAQGNTLAIAGTGIAGSGSYSLGDFTVDAGIVFTNKTGTIAVSNGIVVVGDDYNANNGFNTFNGPGTMNISSGTLTLDPTTGNSTEMDLGVGSGAVGTVNQGAGAVVATGTTTASAATPSTVITGNIVNIGYGGGTGTWNVTNGSTLETGAQAGTSYVIAVGANTTGSSGGGFFTSTGTGSIGTLTVQDTSTFSVGNNGDLQLGTIATIISGGGTPATTAGRGTLTQSGLSTVNLNGNATAEIGDGTAGVGIYNLQGGTLNVGIAANDSAVLTIGANGANGTLNQSGGTLIVGDSNLGAGNTSTFNVGTGATGSGTYTMSGGTSTFYNGVTVGARGTINLNGGTMTVSDTLLTGAGTINFGGGTLALTNGGMANFPYAFAGTLTGGTSTIDASAAGISTFTFANPLQGNGTTVAGLNLIGDGATVFKFASVAGGVASANTYTGSTGIFNGTLDANGADLSGAAAGTTLTIGATGSPATLNLAYGTGAAPNLTLNQAILGNGTLNVNAQQANSTLTLTNTAGTAGTVNIVLGANTGPNASATPLTLQVFGGSFGTISDNGSASSVIIGNGTSTGAVTFGTTAYTGSTTVNTGSSLTAGNLQGNVVNNGTLVVTNNIGATAANTVNNTGNLTAGNIVGDVVTNTGTMNVTGPLGINGNVDSNAGTLIVSGAGGITGNVTNSGTLAAVSALSLTNSGLVRTVTPLTNFAITNAFTSTGTFAINVQGAASDTFTAGSANLSGTVLVTGASLSTTTPTTYNIVTTTGALNDNGLVTQNSFLLNTTLAVVGGNVLQLSVTTNPFVGSTPNQQALANVLNANPNNPITIAVTNDTSLTQADESRVLQSLIPENLQFATFINIENVNYLVQRVGNMEADLRNGNGGLDTNAISVSAPGFQSGMGRQLGSMLAYNDPGIHTSAPNGVNYYPGQAGRNSPSPSGESPSTISASSPAASEPATFDSSSQVISDSPNPYLANVQPGSSETPRLNEFIGGDVILADLNQNPSANANAKASYTAGDVTAGVSYRVTNHFAAGVLFDYNHTDADTDNNGGKTKIDSYTPGIFATYFDHGFYANGLFAVGLNDYKYTSNTFLGQTTGSPSGEQYTGDLDAGYDFHPTKNWIVGPSVGLTYTHVDVDSFTENGAPGAALNVDDQSVDSLRSRLGGHVTFQTNTGDVLLQPSLTAMWQHEYLNDSQGITSSFANTALNPFTIETAAPSRDSALIGIGLNATLSNSMSLYLNYMADVGASNYFSQTVMGGIKARF